MTAGLLLSVVLTAVVGLTIGLLGGGGAILLVPILVYVAGWDAGTAVAASLVVVGGTSLVSTVMHARHGRVLWGIGLGFGVSAMAGSFAGGMLANLIPARALMIAFSLVMLIAGIAMLRPRPDRGDATWRARWWFIALLGIVIGFVSGLVGAGGGFLIVPALALVAGLPMGLAVGTSLLIITLQSASGLIGHLMSVRLDWPAVLAMIAMAILGSLGGAALSGRIGETVLRRCFGAFVVVIAVGTGVGQLVA